MAAKEVLFHDAARSRIIDGVNILVELPKDAQIAAGMAEVEMQRKYYWAYRQYTSIEF